MHFDNTPSNRRTGIILFSLVTLSFAGLDTAGKWLVTHLPVIEVVWFRFLIHFLITAAWILPKKGATIFKVQQPRLQVLRSLMMLVMTALNFFALQYLQLAQTSAIQFSTPILISVFSFFVFKENLPLKKWLAILGGFMGILVILNPFAHNFHPAMLIAVINALVFASFNLMSRKMASTEDPGITMFFSALGPTLILAPFAIHVWQTPETSIDMLAIFITGLLGFVGHLLLAVSYRFAKATTLTPFIYQQIIYMVFFGFVVFGQLPHWDTVWGAIIVIASGLYLLFHETDRRLKCIQR